MSHNHHHHQHLLHHSSSLVVATPADSSASETSSTPLSPEDTKKWMCDICTYENFPTAIKCTMCHATNNKVLSEKNQHNNRKLAATAASSTDIFKMGATSLSRSSSPQFPANHPVAIGSNQTTICCDVGNDVMISTAAQSTQKWGCQMCTYLNWPKAARCTQCLTARRRVSPVVSRNSPISPRSTPKPSSIESLPNNLDALKIHRQQQHSDNRPCSSSISTSPLTGNSFPSNLGSAMASCSSQTGNKWKCGACTYENWPRTRRCVLCGTTKDGDQSSASISSSSESTSTRESPPPQGAASNTPSSTSALSLSTATVNRPSAENYNQLQQQQQQVEESNWDYERKMRQFRRRLREADWSWLTACMGVVEGDMNPVEAYLNTGGDPTRKLANPEVALLNRPSVYEAGHTLVHLAIK